MIHRITLVHQILQDYEKRGVFTRFHWGSQHPMMSDISAKVSSDELRILLTDAESQSHVALNHPNLTRAYVTLARKGREMLRAVPAQVEVGRDGKSAAAHDYD